MYPLVQGGRSGNPASRDKRAGAEQGKSSEGTTDEWAPMGLSVKEGSHVDGWTTACTQGPWLAGLSPVRSQGIVVSHRTARGAVLAAAQAAVCSLLNLRQGLRKKGEGLN